MSGSIQSRLANLEYGARLDVCHHCGLGRDGLPVPIVFGKIDFNAPPALILEPQPCPICGVTPMKFGRVTFDGDREIKQ